MRTHPPVFRATRIGVLIAAAVVLLTACTSTAGGTPAASGNAAAASAGAGTTAIPAPTTLITPGTLTVLTSGTYAPMEYIDSTTHQLTGFDIDLARALAARIGSGLKVQFKSMQFSATIPALQAKQGDAIISALTMTKARMQVVNFVPYFQTGEVILVEKGNPLHLVNPPDLCGQTVGVEVSTNNQAVLEQLNTTTCASKPINIKVYPQTSAAVLAVQSGSIPAVVDSSFNLSLAVQANPSVFQIGGPPFDPIVQGLGTLPANTSLQAALRTALRQGMGDGTCKTLLAKYSLQQDSIPVSYVTNPPTPSK